MGVIKINFKGRLAAVFSLYSRKAFLTNEDIQRDRLSESHPEKGKNLTSACKRTNPIRLASRNQRAAFFSVFSPFFTVVIITGLTSVISALLLLSAPSSF